MTISLSQLEMYLWEAANILRGTVTASEYKSIIFPLIFLKRLSDVYDEECNSSKSNNRLIHKYKSDLNGIFIPADSHWNRISIQSKNLGQFISNAISIIEMNNSRLRGIFGDTNWKNTNRLSDKTLLDLVKHFSTLKLNLINVPHDEFGTAYEFLIKKFADDGGHSGAEFYTNRTVVKLMTLIADPRNNESIYDPTCGSGGMLINARNLIREKGKEFRSVKLYGQEINIMTSSIARMNMVAHGVQDFAIAQGDTLRHPAFAEDGQLKKFDIVIANPPYSMKKWDRKSWERDPWNRNIYGIPPQGIADYAFFQHIICSLQEDTGRCAILWPHGILFRDPEREMRMNLVETDIIDSIIGLGPNLFYNSAMESCIVICRNKKPKNRKGNILFINGKNEITKSKNKNLLSNDNIQNLYKLYIDHSNIPNLSHIASLEEIRSKNYSLSIHYYIKKDLPESSEMELGKILIKWQKSSYEVKNSYRKLLRNMPYREGKLAN